MTKIFAGVAILGALLAAVFNGHDHPVLNGLGKAFFGVFFIMTFLAKLGFFWTTEKPETTHDHGGLMGKGGHGHGH